MAFSLTTEQIRKGTKTVTRRMGWDNLKPGEQFCGIVKGMGLKKGETVERMAILRCVSNKPERLAVLIRCPAYGKAEAAREGFPEMTGHEFVNFFKKSHRGTTIWTAVNRIAFEYVQFLP